MSIYRPKKVLSAAEKILTNSVRIDHKAIGIHPIIKNSSNSTNTVNHISVTDNQVENPSTISVISSSRASVNNRSDDNTTGHKKHYNNGIFDLHSPTINTSQQSGNLLESPLKDMNKSINKPLKNMIDISLRWVNLSSALCSLIFPISSNSDTNISNDAVNQFLDVMKWRATGDINEREFTVLYGEFLSTTQSSTNATATDSSSSKKQSSGNSSMIGTTKQSKKKQIVSLESTIGVHKLRDYLIDKEICESDLDLYIGMLMNEVNLRLLNTSISFNNIPISSSLDENIQGIKGSYVLETCSSQWLSLCEECFFCLDTHGYGILRFDEVFFLSACLSIGVQGWSDSMELEGDLALGTLAAMTVQLMRDCGASTAMTSDVVNISQQFLQTSKGSDTSTSKILDDVDSSSMNNLKNTSSLKNQYGKHGITVTMFKLYLMNKGIGESSLKTMIAHIRNCITKVARICKNCAEDLYNSFKSIDDFGNQSSGAIGCPRLWQQAVLSYSNVDSMNVSKTMPPIVLFLLTDGDKYVSSLLRAMECGIDGTKFIAMDSKQLNKAQPLHSASAANDELHEISYKLWLYFRIWSVGYIRGNNGLNGHSPGVSTTIGGSGDANRDPIYQFIVAVIVQYKALQNLLCAALYDMTVTNFGFPQSDNSIKEYSKTVLSVASANLIPDYTAVLLELGFESDNSKNESFTSDNTNNLNSVPDGENNDSFNKSPERDVDDRKPPLQLNDLNNSIIEKNHTNKQIILNSESKNNDNKNFKISSSRHVKRKNFELNQFKKQTNRNSNTSSPENNISIKSPISSPSQQLQMSEVAYNQSKKELIDKSNNINVRQDNVNVTIDDIIYQNGNTVDENKVTKVTNELISALQNLGYSITPKGPTEDRNIHISIPVNKEENNKYEKDFHISRSNSFSASDVSSSVGPSSIADLLQQGQTAGKYAQMLREILRKMSKDDSNVKLKSLEQVIKLGNTLVQTEIDNNESNRSRSPQNANKVKINRSRSIQESSKELEKPVSPNEQFSIRRIAKVPGHIPNNGKSDKKVFGHKMI